MVGLMKSSNGPTPGTLAWHAMRLDQNLDQGQAERSGEFEVVIRRTGSLEDRTGGINAAEGADLWLKP